jgi:hypothetical protein
MGPRFAASRGLHVRTMFAGWGGRPAQIAVIAVIARDRLTGPWGLMGCEAGSDRVIAVIARDRLTDPWG